MLPNLTVQNITDNLGVKPSKYTLTSNLIVRSSNPSHFQTLKLEDYGTVVHGTQPVDLSITENFKFSLRK